MTRRAMPYMICILLASLFTVIPAAIMFDIATPLDRWENWYWRGQPDPRPTFRYPDKVPRLFRVEEATFKVLVIPPGILTKALTGRPGAYAHPYLSTVGSSEHSLVYLPPLAVALQHARIALPFWLILFVLLYESAHALRRRSLRRGRQPHGIGQEVFPNE